MSDTVLYRMAYCVKEEKNDKSFHEILENLENEERNEMHLEEIC